MKRIRDSQTNTFNRSRGKEKQADAWRERKQAVVISNQGGHERAELYT